MERRINWILETVSGSYEHKEDIRETLLAAGVSTDTRTLTAGNLYIPLIGDVFDGHQFIDKAVEAGAVASLWQEDHALPDVSIPLIVVPSTLLAMQQMAERYLTETCCRVVAITGSNGKTTTKDLVAGVLATTFEVHKTVGNYNNHIGLPLTVLQMPETTEVVVLEMGMNHAGEISELSKLARPDIAMVTNIGESHIGYLGSREKIAQAKLEICDGLSKNGTLLLDGDEPLLKKDIPFGNIVSIGWDKKCKEGPEEVQSLGLAGWTFASRKTGHHFTLPLLGRHNIKNALFAIETGRLLDIPEEDIAKGLQDIPVTPMRLEAVVAKNGMKIINDSYNASPTSVYAAVDILAEVEPELEKWALLAGIEELGDEEKSYHEQVGEYAVTKNLAGLITIGAKGLWIYEAAKLASPNQMQLKHFSTNEEAFSYLVQEGNENILLLVKASRKAGLDRIVKQLVEGA
ncbi:UDP-N-acetylmuramoyl-tripeptide--D-alanyl-D-alanine ligase [Shimazuella sp. AN120528]|uniref:UDP-N-acetylmuramoyl-tripeptide--D-alanyl-D- alanine ligase n=1 Tax=Shimazuella soli TaxID=1892854 RepID=UPI001F0EC84F|nr:UDP-N-acetylmuramoyl-tripeptide--D-alanyl-D-alanine ligase [Shimazuella soli]MCH5584701.1 UDP-N-acetylmuramoyl-tripeptide--D-alanyl-D-alanine ligase [Shimazuella soli]